MKNNISVLIAILLTAAICFAQTDVSGNVSGTWAASASPYIVTNNLVLQPADTLTIEPGVEVRFDGSYRFDIFGALFALGSAENGITFTRNGTVNWMSLNFSDQSNDNSILQFCTIEYGSNSGYEPYWGVINMNDASPTISNCTIQNNSQGGLNIHGAQLQPQISNNLFQYNSGVCISCNTGSPTIDGNIIISNNSTAISLTQSDSITVNNNTITSNGGYGISFDNSDNAIIEGNTISNNESTPKRV